MAEFDALGRDAFLDKYGFGPAKKYTLWYEGRPYDSKAIVGAAFGYLPGKPKPLTSGEFTGGTATVVSLLERLGFGFADQPSKKAQANPPWTREQALLVLDLYHRHGGRDPGADHPDVVEMSALLRQLASDAGTETFRNPNGVKMKMMNFRSLDPAWTSKGGAGLKGASKLDRALWDEFYGKRQDLAVAVEAIRQSALATMSGDELDEVLGYKAKEGKVSYRYHRTLERDPKVVALRKASALKQHGTLACEACGFDFQAIYGERGTGYIEAHHTNPVHAMVEGDETTVDDLALLCSNCHRMVHTAKPWLTLEQLRELVASNPAG
ncbi:HNH endonuclease [Novosphingobium sp. FSY-8]|uniref:HNH endonuclease n=1 Tax=Novosphingobium ovatum TaxID=1908523 RepID=A0ABW9XHN5_9SPHN|nr:HNH endonuclease [Novosphingobium ovatum]NBC38011.1 HNH endonuclease [Novosphingobium ovatum]